MQHKTAVVIGRFSPVHYGHVELFRTALELAERLVIYVGSPRDHSSKNPWGLHERTELIQASMGTTEDRISFRAAYDHPSDTIWARRIVEAHEAIYGDANPILVGKHKDESSFYLDLFPQWAYREVETEIELNATDVRKAFFKEQPDFALIESHCHPHVVTYLKEQYDAGFNEKFKERFK